MNKFQKVLVQKIAILSGSIFGLVLLLFIVANNQTVVNFPDKGLELAIRKKINKPQGSILLSEVRKISRLNASCWNISSLEGLENLTRLEELNLESNQVKDLKSLRGLKKLTYLNLRNNNIIHLDSLNFNAIKELPIRRLSLQYNVHDNLDGTQIKLSDISSLSQLKNLEVLELRDNGISELSPLVNLIKLEKLDLRENQIEDIAPLSELINLKELNLRDNKINDLSALSYLRNLHYLNIHSNGNINSLEPIGDLTGLQTLILRNVPVGNTIGYIKEMINLKRLNIANCKITDISVLAALFSSGAFPNEINKKEVKSNLLISNNKKNDSNLNLSENSFNWNSIDSLLSVLNFRDDIDFQYPTWLPEVFKLDPVNFSHTSGFYSNAINISISHNDPDVTIIYTLDGSEPELNQVNSTNQFRKTYIYTEPLNIKSRIGEPNLFSEIKTTGNIKGFLSEWLPPKGEVFKSTVVRAKAVISGRIISEIKTATFFVDENIKTRYSSIPVISLVADYKDLFDNKTGIYVPGHLHKNVENEQNFNKGWKRKVHLEYYDIDRQKGFKDEYIIKIQGLTSTTNPIKGLFIIADSNIGDTIVNYPLFSNTNFKSSKITNFSEFIIRGWGSALSWPVFFSDAYNQKLVATTDIDIQSYKPVILFINGEYWGLHELREANKNSLYYRSHYGAELNNTGIDLIDIKSSDLYELHEGSIDEWNKVLSFIRTNDMSDVLNFEQVSRKIDINNLIKFIIHCTYLGKWDWPDQNEAMWRPKESSAKWRFIQRDMDWGMNEWFPNYDMIKHVMNGGIYTNRHELFVCLMENLKFRNQFLSTYADWMNTILSTQSELTLFKAMTDELQPYVQEFRERWPMVYNWEKGLEHGRNIILERRDLRIMQLKSFFELSNVSIKLEVNNIMGGHIKINSIEIKDGVPGVPNDPYPWTGTYFTTVPVKLEAVPNEGFKFVGWRFFDTVKELKRNNNKYFNACDPVISITPYEDITVNAIFEPFTKDVNGKQIQNI